MKKNTISTTLLAFDKIYFIKKISRCIIVMSALTLFNSSCVKVKDFLPDPPVANFSYSGNLKASAPVSFTNSSTNGTSYSWDFGDNTFSSVTNPVHTFNLAGNYTVELTADGTGGSNTVSKTIIIAP